MNDVLAQALSYLRRGWSLLPVAADKRPLLRWSEFQKRRPNEAELGRWFDEEGVGVGIVTGTISGLLVLDADGVDGVNEAQRHGVPRTPTATTPRGGCHFYFRHPGGVVLRNGAHLGSSRALDVRSEGGYVVAPPSVGPNGRRYEWLVPPQEVSLAAPPQWLFDLQSRRGNGGARAGRPCGPPVGLKKVLSRLPERIVDLIVKGPHGSGYPSRSEADAAVVLELVRQGATDAQIRSLFTRYPIGEKFRERSEGAGRAYLDRTIATAREVAPARRLVRIEYADLKDVPPGRAPGQRIYLLLVLEDGTDPGRGLRVGVSVPDGYRPCEERFEALFQAAGVGIPTDEPELIAACDALIGRRMVVELDEDRRNPVFRLS